MAGPYTTTPATGDGVTTVFTSPVVVSGDVLLTAGRFVQTGGGVDYSYSVSPAGTTFTFTVAPGSGDALYFWSGSTVATAGIGITTLLNVRTAAQQRADMVNSQFLTTPEWNANINASYAELYDILIQKYGNDYFAALDSNGSEYRITTNGAADKYPLPDGSTQKMPDGTTAPAFYKMLGCDLYLNGVQPSSRINIYPFTFAERSKFSAPNLPAWGGRLRLQYRLLANKLWLIPLPAGGQTIGLWYAPRLSPLIIDSDSLDGVSGWEEYVVVDAAIKALQKEESDVSVLFAQKQALIKRIEEASENRDAGSPATVADIRDDMGRGGSWGPWSGWPY